MLIAGDQVILLGDNEFKIWDIPPLQARPKGAGVSALHVLSPYPPCRRFSHDIKFFSIVPGSSWYSALRSPISSAINIDLVTNNCVLPWGTVATLERYALDQQAESTPIQIGARLLAGLRLGPLPDSPQSGRLEPAVIFSIHATNGCIPRASGEWDTGVMSSLVLESSRLYMKSFSCCVLSGRMCLVGPDGAAQVVDSLNTRHSEGG